MKGGEINCEEAEGKEFALVAKVAAGYGDFLTFVAPLQRLIAH
jgi:hypothetical protein